MMRTQMLALFESQIDALDAAVAELPVEMLDRPSGNGRGTIRLWVHHLADTALVGACRVRAIVAEVAPTLPAHDFAAWEARLGYADRSIESSLAVYRAARRSTLEVLRRLPHADWERHGDHAALGKMGLDNLVRQQCEDAKGHLDDILAERSNPPTAVAGGKQALLVVDVLAAIFELGVPLHDAEGFLSRARALLERARERGTPVIHVLHHGPPGSPFAPGAPGRRFHERVAPRAGEIVIEKENPDAFQATSLDATSRGLGVTELVVAGFATEACIDATVRSAFARGYSVVLVSDCHTTTRNEVLTAAQIVDHHNAVLRRFARVVKLADLELAARRYA